MARDLENQKRLAREWYQRNRELTKERARVWAEENPERRHEIHRKNRDKDRDNHNARNRAWNAKNQHVKTALEGKRRATKLQATPNWLSTFQLKQMADTYAIAAKLTGITGELYHVDHIVPLQGKKVSGLHVPWNLQVIPAKDNLAKSNKH